MFTSVLFISDALKKKKGRVTSILLFNFMINFSSFLNSLTAVFACLLQNILYALNYLTINSGLMCKIPDLQLLITFYPSHNRGMYVTNILLIISFLLKI